MLPGKKYSPDDVLQILRRRYWLLLVPLAVVSAGFAVVARSLPNTWRSATTILIVPQRVPEAYVKSTVTQTIEERLQTISQTILSRTRLERIIQDFNLYADERKSGIMEDIVQKMATKDIKITPTPGNAFQVSYTGSDRIMVQKVAEKIGSLYIEESTRDREILAEGTDQFLEAQVEEARNNLLAKEKQVKEYTEAHAGELPEQLQANMQANANTQMEIRALTDSLDRDAERRLALERLRDQLQMSEPPPQPEAPPVSADGMPTGGTATQQVAILKQQLALALTTYSEDNFRVKRLRTFIEDLQKKADAEELQGPVSGAQPRLSQAEILRRQNLAAVQGELQNLARQMASKVAQEKQLRAMSTEYQRKIDAVPNRTAEMVELNRDYQAMQASFASLRAKKEDSRISANLERRQVGEQFRIVDPARLPERPSSPNREQINFMGIAVGLGIGLGLVLLLEYRDGTFKTDSEISSVLELPVLAVVPLMQSDKDRKRLLRRRIVINVGLGGTVAGCLAVLAYTFVR